MSHDEFDDTGSYPLSDPATPAVTPSRIRLLLADPYPIVLDGLEQMFEFQENISVEGRCTHPQQLHRLIREFQPEVAIVEPRLFEDPLQQLQEIGMGRTRVVVFTTEVHEDDVISLLRVGVRGVVLKDMPSRLLVSCVRKVAAGDLWLEKASVARALEKIIRQEAHAQQVSAILSPREIEVLRLAAQGMRNRAIAARLFVAEGTVKMHLHSIYEKLHIRSRIELADFARDRGLILR